MNLIKLGLMVKVICSGTVFDNGTYDMAQNLMYASYFDKEDYPYSNIILVFKDEEFYDETCSFYSEGRAHDLDLYFTPEQCKQWEETQKVVFPAVHVKSIKVYNESNSYGYESLAIEIESDNDDTVVDIFHFFEAMGNGGHSFGGTLKINELKDTHIGYFGFDGDGCDGIDSVIKV